MARKVKRGGAEAYAKKRWWHFWGEKNQQFDENADPKVQMYQAMQEAQESDRRLRESAATVIGNQRNMEMRLDKMLDELEELQRKTQSALKLESKTTDPAKKAEYSAAARRLYTALQNKTRDVETQKAMVLQATQAAEQAKHAVEQNSRQMEEVLSKRQQLLAQNDQAQMQESMNTAIATLNSQVGDGIIPTFGEVEAKIQTRMANALGATQVASIGAGQTMAAIDAAADDMEAEEGLDAMRRELGLLNEPAELPAGATEPSIDELADRRAQGGS